MEGKGGEEGMEEGEERQVFRKRTLRGSDLADRPRREGLVHNGGGEEGRAERGRRKEKKRGNAHKYLRNTDG